MTAILRGALLGITLFTAFSSATTGVWGTPAARSQTMDPAGSAVLRQSSARMRRSLHALHTEGYVELRLSRRRARLRVSGDCVMGPRSEAFRFWSRGSSFVNGVRDVVDDHYIFVRNHTWKRSAAVHNVWQRADSDQGALLSINLCPAFYMLMPGIAPLVPRARNLGAVTLRGAKLWHIQIRGVAFVIDVFVDQRSYYWVRLVSDQRGPPQQHAVFDYSMVNETVSIEPPKTRSAHPIRFS